MNIIETQIRKAIDNLKEIVLKQEDQKGSGTFSEVYLHTIERTQLAVKCFKNQYDANAIKEQDTLQKIQSIAKDCPGLFSSYGMKKLDVKIITRNNQILHSQRNCLFLQGCKGNLKEINFPKNEFFNFLSQISISLFCLHVNGCSHSDLKPANILYNINNKQEYQYYLADFGSSEFFEDNSEESYFLNQSVRGTPLYFSPELKAIFKEGKNKIKLEGNYNSFSSDIYAIGLICLELLIGKKFVQILNQASDQKDQYNQELVKIKGELLQLSEFSSNPLNEILIMLLNMVSFDRKQRPQAIEISQKLIEAKLFTIDALSIKNMKALISQFITSFKPLKKRILQQKKVKQVEEESKIIDQHNLDINKKINSIQKEIIIPTFQSNVLQDSVYSSLILSLFQDSNLALEQIHYQKFTENFDAKKFHTDCDKKGSTLVIFKSSQEPNSFFGGMAVPQWESPKNYYWNKDPADKQSWLFKVELEGQQINLHQWKCVEKEDAIMCHKYYGPNFGQGGLYYYKDFKYNKNQYYNGLYYNEYKGYTSYLPSNNNTYKKQDLNFQLNNENNLLCQLKTKISINCPTQVIGKIMNEDYIDFSLIECEVFMINK